MTFRVNCKNFFLTYPQCDIGTEALLSFFQDKFGVERPFNYVISQERHEDGGLHLHALLSFKTKLDVRRNDYFDCQGAHCNIQAARDVKATREYVKKDGDFIEKWDAPDATSWGEIVTQSRSKEDFLKRCAADKPRDYVLSLERLEYFAGRHFRTNKPEYEARPLDSFNVPVALDDWVWGNLKVRSKILIGLH